MGLLLSVVVHSAGIQDRDGAKLVFEKARDRFPRMKRIWAGGSYAGQLLEWLRTLSGWILEIVKRPKDAKRFTLLPRRWVVERTFAWFGRYWRLSKDYEYRPETSEAMLQLAMIHIMVRGLAKNSAMKNQKTRFPDTF